jgi:hypothetical protein
MAVLLLLLMVALQLLIAAGTELKRAPNDTSTFVTVQDGQFLFNGRQVGRLTNMPLATEHVTVLIASTEQMRIGYT